MQSNHATRGITALYPQGEGVPNIVLIGVPDTAALLRVRDKLATAQIPHYCFTEPDHDFGMTAIATAALEDGQREALRNYRLWNIVNNARGVGQPACEGNLDSRTNAPGASVRCSPFNGDGGAKAGVAQ